MPTTDDCMRCTKPCPQAELAHETAVKRMHVTNELLFYVKKVDSGQLVEVVRCKDCKHLMFSDCYGECGAGHYGIVRPDHFCSYGERKEAVRTIPVNDLYDEDGGDVVKEKEPEG